MTKVTSAMSPGYLQINSYFNERASKLSRQYGKPDEVNADKKSEDDAVKNDAVLGRKSAIKDNEDNQTKETEKNKTSASDNSSREKAEDHKERAIISELARTEREVIAHEAAHVAVGGRFVGTPKYTREVGPDGQSYIIGGEVPIMVPPSSDPEETIRNMQQVRDAALAPINPSAQDINVAAAAANAQMQAESELAAHKAEWGETPEPPRNHFDATDRVPAEPPKPKQYRSSVNEDPGSIISSINRVREEALNNVKTLADSAKMAERETSQSSVSPKDNLYNIRQAIKIYYMTSSPKGLWTVENGFEKTASTPELKQAQFLNLAA